MTGYGAMGQPVATYAMPGEFERHAAVWLGWPTVQWFRAEELDTRQTIAAIAEVLSDYRVTANIMCTDEQGICAAQEWMRQHGYPVTAHMNFLPIRQVDVWVRDYGPIFLKDRSTDELAIASYAQNQWGYSTTADPVSVQMTELPGLVAEYLGIGTVLSTELVSEGGDRIQNGEGTLVVNRAVEFQRNPGVSQAELEAAYEATLGVTDIIWLNAGMCEDLHTSCGPIPYTDGSGERIHLYGPQTTGGHLDEFCQFASPARILLARVSEEEASADPIAAVNYERLEEAHRILSEATGPGGKPFEIMRLPTPDIDFRLVQPDEPMHYDFLATLDYPDDVPPFPEGQAVYIVKASSYANYLVTNGLVIAPRYGNQAKDDAAMNVLKAAFPGRDVVQIDPTPLNYAGGGIHCSTQQQPAGVVGQPA